MKLRNYSLAVLIALVLGSGWCGAQLPSGYSVKPSRDPNVFVVEIGTRADNLGKALLFNERAPLVWQYLEPVDFGSVNTVFEGVNDLYKKQVGDNSVRGEYRSRGQDYVYTLLDSLYQKVSSQIDAGLVMSADMEALRKSMQFAAGYLLDRFPNVYTQLNNKFPVFGYSYEGLIQQICALNPSDKMLSPALPASDDSKLASESSTAAQQEARVEDLSDYDAAAKALRVIAPDKEETLATLINFAQNAWNGLETTGVDGVEQTYKNYTDLFVSMVNPIHEGMINAVNTRDFILYTAAFSALLESLKSKIETMIASKFFRENIGSLELLSAGIQKIANDLDGKLGYNMLNGTPRSHLEYFMPTLRYIRLLIRDENWRLAALTASSNNPEKLS